MVETGSTPAMAQRCNLCWQEANGACFRTQCGHLFCESCAFQHFGQSQTCPTCGVSLEEADIADVTIGLAPTQFRRMVFQEIYKEPDFRSVGQSAVRAAMTLHESLAFVLAQTTLEGQRAVESVGQMKADLAKQRHENGRLTMQVRNQNASLEQKVREADHKLRIREKELLDLQEAYKEKSRKCQAWEKAYGNLRSQTGRSRDGGGFTPPESPRVGALRGPTGAYASMTQQRVSPRGSGSGVEGSSNQRPDERLRTNSPHSNVTSGGTFLGRGDQGSGGGGSGGGGASWAVSRPTTSRGGGGDHHISPMLRPRQAQGFSHSVTPSPTFSTQPGPSSRFTSKRPETPQEVRAYYPHDSSPSHRVSNGVSGGGGGGRSGGGATSGVRGGFFPVGKSNSLF